MCCLLACSAVVGPRLVFLLVWIFGDRVTVAFAAEPFNGLFWWPLLGLLFAPWTSLMYIVAFAPVGGVTGFGVFLVGLGILADIASYAGGVRSADYR